MARLRPWRALAAVLVWLVVSAGLALVLFLSSSRTIEVASHEARIRPDLSGEVVVRAGPVLPDVRMPSGSRIGVALDLGKTSASSINALTQRYVAIATHPDGQILVVRHAVRSMAIDAAVRGAALGAVPLLLWAAVGPRRRRELVTRAHSRTGVVTGLILVLVATAAAQPWRWGTGEESAEHWTSAADFVGPGVPIPHEVADLQVLSDSTSASTRQLLQSAIRAYRSGLSFYSTAEEKAAALPLHRPGPRESVTLLLADRHDNIDMDGVARAIARAGGATSVIDAGDDTSAGEGWERFSVDSLAEAFSGTKQRWAVAGNHDHGSLVRSYLSKHGWTYFTRSVLDGPGGSRIYGADDPRSSGLGNWRDMYGADFVSAQKALADRVCDFAAHGDRLNTLLVHDPNIGKDVLARGCVDLVIGGHIHVEEGPTRVVGSDGHVGYRFVVGTAGGAAYAIALGKLRRDAGVALITYRAGRPVGIQGVTLRTNGRYSVDPYTRLRY